MPIFVTDTKKICSHNFVAPLKEDRCKFKIDKLTSPSPSVKQGITLPKQNLQCILELFFLGELNYYSFAYW